MKPFDLKAALAGAKVVTRDGREVKIAGYNKEICPANIALLGWVYSDFEWWERAWFENGSYLKDEFDGFDLFMAPTERKEWILRIDYGRGPLIEGPFKDFDYCKERAAYHYNKQGLNTIHEITIHE